MARSLAIHYSSVYLKYNRFKIVWLRLLKSVSFNKIDSTLFISQFATEKVNHVTFGQINI